MMKAIIVNEGAVLFGATGFRKRGATVELKQSIQSTINPLNAPVNPLIFKSN